MFVSRTKIGKKSRTPDSEAGVFLARGREASVPLRNITRKARRALRFRPGNRRSGRRRVLSSGLLSVGRLGEMHYVFSGLPANQDLNEMVPQYEQMSLFGQDKAVQQKAEKPFDELEQAVDGEVLRFGILTYRLDLAQLIRSCTLEILNANGCIVDEMNLDSAIPMNWKEAVPEDEITKFKEETGNEYGVQIDSIPEFKPRKKFVRKDG